MVDLLVMLAQGLCVAALLYCAYRSIRGSKVKAVRRRRRQHAGLWARYSAYRKCGSVPVGRIRL